MSLFQKSTIVIIVFLTIFLNVKIVLARDTYNLDKYISYFYNRYSKHFDNFGLKYSSSEYGIKNFKEPETSREWMAIASYYKYRSINGSAMETEILVNAIDKAYQYLSNKNPINQSFEDAESYFLLIRIFEINPLIITDEKKQKILNLIANYAENGILANDTENRAIISATHWQYIINYIFKNQTISSIEKHYYDYLIKKKIDYSIKECITNSGWYFENKFKNFSVHYHTVSAFMLMLYGDMVKDQRYLALAEKMYYNIKKISFKNGMVEARLGHRPLGLGSQFYLMQGLLGKYFNDADYSVYLFYAQGHRFFSDKRHPDRLEFHSTIEKSESAFHDDYAFSDKSELGLTIEKLRDINLDFKYYFDNQISKSNDNYFKIENNGQIIIMNNKKNTLGSYGNWSHIYQYAERN